MKKLLIVIASLMIAVTGFTQDPLKVYKVKSFTQSIGRELIAGDVIYCTDSAFFYYVKTRTSALTSLANLMDDGSLTIAGIGDNQDTSFVKTTTAQNVYGVKTWYSPLVTAAGTNGNNVRIGLGSLANVTTGYGNVAISPKALYANTTGIHNIAIGDSASSKSTTASRNVFLGGWSGYQTTNGSGNIGIGYWSLVNNTTSADNVVIGDAAGVYITTGSGNTVVGKGALTGTMGTGTPEYNTAIGHAAMYEATGNYNCAVGKNVLSNCDGNYNTGIGFGVLYSTTTGYGNYGGGASALYSNTTGYSNIAIGDSALMGITDGVGNIGIGSGALGLAKTNALYNIAIGHGAGYEVKDGYGLVAIGNSAANKVDTIGGGTTIVGWNSYSSFTGRSQDNTCIGGASFSALKSGNYNAVLGAFAGTYTKVAGNNVFIGSGAATGIDTAYRNVIIGNQAGYGTPITSQTMSDNIFIGYKAGYSTYGSNKLIIHNTFGGADTALIYGDFSTPSLQFNAAVETNGDHTVTGHFSAVDYVTVGTQIYLDTNIYYGSKNGLTWKPFLVYDTVGIEAKMKIQNLSDVSIQDKVGTGQVEIIERDTTGASALANLSNIKTITASGLPTFSVASGQVIPVLVFDTIGFAVAGLTTNSIVVCSYGEAVPTADTIACVYSVKAGWLTLMGENGKKINYWIPKK